MKYVLIALVALTLVACANSGEEKTNGDTVRKDSAQKIAVTGIQAYKPNIDFTDWEGNLREAVYWKDSLGENIFIISGIPQYFWKPMKPSMRSHLRPEQDPETFEEATEIFAYHYVLPTGEAKWKLHSQMSDYRMGCCDVFMDYQDGSLAIVNEDKNGTAEICFMYNATEADGMLTKDYLGTMVLLMDTTYYRSLGPTGIANKDAISSTEPQKQVQLRAPDGVYTDFMSAKWKEYFEKRLELDSILLVQ